MHLNLARATACTTGIIFPLYFYPGDNCASWAPLISSINAHPRMPFTLIVNPNTGPVPDPDINYQNCIQQLRPASVNPFTKVIGYVHTSNGSRNSTEVEAEIDQYNSWALAYRPDGIFFDEVNVPPNATIEAQYQTWESYIRSKTWASSPSFITLNPGTEIDAAYWPTVDQIATFEDFFANFANSKLTFSTAKPASKQAVIIHTTTPVGTVPSSTISTLVNDGVGRIFLTDVTFQDNPYNSFPSYWDALISTLASDENC